MPRMARIVIPDVPHHITQRGNRREDIFFDDKDRRRSSSSRKWRLCRWAYSLLSTLSCSTSEKARQSGPFHWYPQGLEPKYVTTCGNKDLQNPSPEGGAESGAVSPISGRVDARLRRVIDAWPDLPEAVKAGILAMVKASGSDRTP